jgi:predicted AAA+ superfamily ATPase
MHEKDVCKLIEKQLKRPEIVWLFGARQTGIATI